MDVATASGVIEIEIMGRCRGRNQLSCVQWAKLEVRMYTHGITFSSHEIS
jgi:hypothetical protein